MDKFLYPTRPVACKITGPSDCGKSNFLTNLISNIITDFENLYIYSPSFHQDLYQKLIIWFKKYIPFHIKPNILNEEYIDLVIDEIDNDKDFENSDTQIETCELKEEQKYCQENEDIGKIFPDDLNEKEMNGPRVQEMFKRSRHKILSIFMISQVHYELLKRTIRAKGNICHIFEPNNLKDVQNLFQRQASIDLTLQQFKLLSSICWNQKHQPLTTDMNKKNHW